MMIKVDYKDVTIENVQSLYNTRYINEIVFDANNRSVVVNEDGYLKLENVFKELVNSIKHAIEAIALLGKRIINSLYTCIRNILDKKITKKKFVKLLQSQGIQRNRINKIVDNNREPYTYMRYYILMHNLKE